MIVAWATASPAFPLVLLHPFTWQPVLLPNLWA